VALCTEVEKVDWVRELQIRALGKSTYDYIIEYLSRKGLYPPGPFIRNLDDWFRYSWLLIANTEPVVYWVGKRVRELLGLGVPPDEIVLTAKWVFDVKAKKGDKWVTIAYKDPIITAGLPYWVGFYRVSNSPGVVWGCPANPPGPWYTGNLCSYCSVFSDLFGIYFAGGGKPPSGIQAGVGVNCCYRYVGYNMNQPAASLNYTTDSTGVKNITTWAITGVTTVSVSGPYMFLTLATYSSGGYGVTYGSSQAGGCNNNFCGPSGACGLSSGSYPSVDIELIYENLGSLSIAPSTTISASIQ